MDIRVTEFAAAEAKAKFSELLDRVEAGEELTIRRHGRVVAKVIPVGETPEQARLRRRRARLDWEEFRDKHNITLGPDLTIKQLIEEGRR